MTDLDGCQILCLPCIDERPAEFKSTPWEKYLIHPVTIPLNSHAKKSLERSFNLLTAWSARFRHKGNPSSTPEANSQSVGLISGDWVRVRSREEILITLDRWKELKGCAFLEYIWQYRDTTQRVLQPMERFLDERDDKVKRCKGVVLLEDVICRGTPVFGRCDRGCHLFWREEWLEKIDLQSMEITG